MRPDIQILARVCSDGMYTIKIYRRLSVYLLLHLGITKLQLLIRYDNKRCDSCHSVVYYRKGHNASDENNFEIQIQTW